MTNGIHVHRSILIVLLLSSPVTAATLDVRVTTRGGSAIENAVVYALPSAPMPLARKTAVMDQSNRTFLPHVLPVQTGTWVEFPNSDNVRHQVFSVSPARRFSTPLYIGKPARPIQFPTAGVVAIGCSVHEQMSAYIVVVDTPFFATTDKNGRAAIESVPTGDYSLNVWHEGRTDPKAQPFRVGEGEKQSVTVVD